MHCAGGGGIRLARTPDSRWRTAGGDDLDDWLGARGVNGTEDRTPVLAYGSNACPSKISWLREVHRLRGPLVVLRVEVRGVAAVWAAGLRVVDDQRPATLAADPTAHETHAIWLATPDQIDALDRCEGRGERYDLATLLGVEVRLEDGTPVLDVLAYVGRSSARMPLLVDGRAVRCTAVAQHAARLLTGVPAGDDGLQRDVIAP